jgi:hypothetical protein
VSNRVSVEVQRQIDDHSTEFLQILEKWIHKQRKYIRKFKNEEKEVQKTIGQLFCRVNNDKDNLGYKQFADLLMACRKADCVSEFKLYVAYKGAKESSSWGQKLDGRSLSDHLNDLISDQLKILTLKIVKVDTENFEDIYLAVLEKFLGYLYWGIRVSGANGGEIKCLKA